MPARRWWWQRLHPALRVALATAYFGGAVALFVFAITPGDGEPRSAPVGGEDSSDQVEEPEQEPAEPVALTGRELYDAHCVSCHGPSLEGGSGPALGRGSEAADENDNRLRSRITEGRNEMPAFSDTLSGAEIELVIEFLRDQQTG